MNPSRIVFPGFWFGQSDIAQAEQLAERGVGGFCVYGGTLKETKHFIERVRKASVYDHLLICADIEEDLSEIIKDVPGLPSNAKLGSQPASDNVYLWYSYFSFQSFQPSQLYCPVLPWT